MTATPEENAYRTPAELDDFLKQSRDRYEFAKEAEASDLKLGEDDATFAYADDKDLAQWSPAAKRARKKRPILQWNRIPTYTQQVVNDGRQNKPSIRIAPDDGGTPETANFIQARIRQIEYDSNVDTAKDTAREQQVVTGRGFLRVSIEYIPGSRKRKQRICVEVIPNQFSVLFDPSAVKYDRSDADYCFVISLISKDEHIRRFGKDSLVSRLDFASPTEANPAPDWIGIGDRGDMIQIAEYWVKEYDRDNEVKAVMQYVINGAEILEETEWIGSTIPIVPMWGKQVVVGGKTKTISLVRNSRGPQEILNFAVSGIAELVGQMPKTPFLLPLGSIPAGSKEDWKNVYINALGYLEYKQYDDDGRPFNKPERMVYEPPIQAFVVMANMAIDGIKASMGIFDAAIGAKSNETSGIAIQRRQKESDVTNYHFLDNEARSNKYLGEIVVEILPKVDKKGSIVPTRTEDGKTHLIPVGREHQDPKTGKMVTHDLLSGQYNVSVSTGPSYTSQRQEAYDRDVALVQADPTLLWVIGDQMFASDDTAGSEERSERMRRAIQMKTPGLIQDNQQQQPIPPEIQQKLQQQDQQLQQAMQFAQGLHEQIQTKQVEAENARTIKQMELDFQREKLREDNITNRAKIASTEDIEALRQQIAVLQQGWEQMHAMGMQAAQQDHQADQLDATQQHADAQQDRQQQFDEVQSAQEQQEPAEPEGAE